jgi:hypothetical protein
MLLSWALLSSYRGFLVWDGDPNHYEHTIGDMRMCELYGKHPIFHPSTGNQVFCNTEYEHQVSNQFVRAYAIWNGQLAKDILLQQVRKPVPYTSSEPADG